MLCVDFGRVGSVQPFGNCGRLDKDFGVSIAYSRRDLES